MRNYGDPTENLNPLASHLSRSFKVIGTNTDRQATYDFLLVIHNNYKAYLVPFPR